MRLIAALLVVSLTAFTLSESSSFAQPTTGFIENRGQVDSQVLFYCCGSGAAVYLTADAIVLDLRKQQAGSLRDQDLQCGLDRRETWAMTRGEWGLLKPDGDNRPEPWGAGPGSAEDAQALGGCAIYIWFEGANPHSWVEAVEELPGSYNFFLGNDPLGWRTEVPAFREVIYHAIWPGVDLIWRIEGGELLYEVSVAPDVDPGQVRFHGEGAQRIVEQVDSSLWLETPLGRLVEKCSAGRRSMGKFHLFDKEDRRTEGSADRNDPRALLWSSFLGGQSADWARDISLDASGNPVMLGKTHSSAFPTTPGAYDQSHNGNQDVFVAKLDSSGTELLWGTFLGGSGDDDGDALCLDDSGNPVVAGNTPSSDFPTTPGTPEPLLPATHS